MIDLRSHLAPRIGRAEGQITQAELARRSGIVQPTISAWLSGTRPLALEQQIKLCEAAGFRVSVRVSTPRAARMIPGARRQGPDTSSGR